MKFLLKKFSISTLLALSLLTVGCTTNDLERYRIDGLIPSKPSTFASVTEKAKAVAKERDEESLENALDELADFLMTTSPYWLPIFSSSFSN